MLHRTVGDVANRRLLTFDGRRIRRCDWQRVFVRSGAQSPTCKATRCCDAVHSCMCLCHRLSYKENSLCARCPSGGGDRPGQVHRSATSCSCKASAGGVTLPADKSSAHVAVMSERDIVWDLHALQHASCFLHKARQNQAAHGQDGGVMALRSTTNLPQCSECSTMW